MSECCKRVEFIRLRYAPEFMDPRTCELFLCASFPSSSIDFIANAEPKKDQQPG